MPVTIEYMPCGAELHFYLDDVFLRKGLLSLARAIHSNCFCKGKRMTFFTSDFYYEALEEGVGNGITVLTYSANRCDYISDIKPSYKILKSSSLNDYIDLFKCCMRDSGVNGMDVQNHFTRKEFKTLKLLSSGEGVKSISGFLKISIKTVYTRQLQLYNKLGCCNAISFKKLVNSQPFLTWMKRSEKMHATNNQNV